METNILKSYIKELHKGSHKAFNAIYDMYADKLYGFAFAHTKSREMANDIVQETFLKLWIMRGTISLEGSLQAMLFTMTRNKMIDMFRAQINTIEFEQYVEYCSEGDTVQTDVEKKLFYDDFVNALRMSKKLLTDRQLEIFELSREKGKTIDEIAVQLDISKQTVKNQLTTSIKKLRIHLTNKNLLFGIILEMCFIAQKIG